MIKYILKCNNDHEFESWFSNSEEFEKLNNKNLLECIYCSSKKIEKSIMAPMVTNSKTENENFQISKSEFTKEKNQLLQLRKYIEKTLNMLEKILERK